jgi:hypothetical protein
VPLVFLRRRRRCRKILGISVFVRSVSLFRSLNKMRFRQKQADGYSPSTREQARIYKIDAEFFVISEAFYPNPLH